MRVFRITIPIVWMAHGIDEL